MHLSSTLIAGLLLAGADGVLGGSRFWEAKAPNKRSNPSPDYPAVENLNSTSPLVKRAISIANRPGDNNAARIWPNKKIRYCFEDPEPDHVVRGLWELAKEAWAPLNRHGFSYELVSDEVCESQRDSVLRIHYNSEGKLRSTLGIPVINEEANEADPDNAVWGPYTHLSDMEGIGQDNIRANVAHELGHVWGLGHEHQIPRYWKVSPEDALDSWSIPMGPNPRARFQTNGFNCRNLKDHDAAQARVQAKIDKAVADGDENEAAVLRNDKARLCISLSAAAKHGFSAAEWLPMANTGHMIIDEEFDEDSLMMYPSGAGGHGLGDNRAVVMSYQDGSAIPNREGPSGQDLERLITLYGTTLTSTPAEPHTSKSSGWRQKFKGFRNKLNRAGDTSAGLC